MKRLVKLLSLALLLAAMGWGFTQRGALANFDLQAWVQGLGWAGPAIFMVVYALSALLFLPGTLFTLAGGAVFGLGWGLVYNISGATLGAGLAFLASRWVLGDWVQAKAGPKLTKLQRGIEAEGWRFVAFVRLVPLFPFNLLNYALGLTRISFWQYLLTSYLAMLPGALVYTYLGVVGNRAALGEGSPADWAPQALLALGLVIFMIYLPKLYFRWKRNQMKTIKVERLQQLLDEAGELLLLDLRDAADAQTTGAIAQAQNIPFPQLAEQVNRLEAFKNSPIALICTTSFRSQRAYNLLRDAGFQNLLVVDGGMKDWLEKGLPLETPA